MKARKRNCLIIRPSLLFPPPRNAAGDFSADNYTIYNPLAPDNPDGTRQQFPGNIITNYPGLTLNPTAVEFLSHISQVQLSQSRHLRFRHGQLTPEQLSSFRAWIP